MPYLHLEELTSRKGEKVVLFLTAENMVGLALTALPVYICTTQAGFVLRLLLVGAAAALGFIATWEIGGMALYERVMWRVRGQLRCVVAGRRRTPEQYAGGGVPVATDPPLPLDGPIEELPPGERPHWSALRVQTSERVVAPLRATADQAETGELIAHPISASSSPAFVADGNEQRHANL